MAARLTERDVRVLAKCAVARWLTTGQVHKLFFPAATLDAVRKRLRKLAEAGYLRSLQSHRMAEALHGLGPDGKVVLEGKGLEVDLDKAPPKQLEHFIGINDVRVAVELGDLRVAYFFAAWELGGIGWLYPVIPDAVFAVESGRQSTFIVEYDRGSETVGQLAKKLRSYESGLDGFPFDAVLVTFDTSGRLESLARVLQKRGGSEMRFLGALLSEVREAGMWSRVFVDIGIGGPEIVLKRLSPKDLGNLTDQPLSM